LVREGEGIAAGVLESMNLHLERIRLETNRILAATPEGHDAAEPVRPSPAPPAVSELVASDREARICAICSARCPVYFRFCFNCGAPLDSGEDGERE